ncbi:hypothetical protein MWG54_27310 (plasmid) [Bacillus cereus]|uniref:hypothetical protein n=1 Tax=Bacillus cereus TaxID=1396 RepID=UPI001FF24148|nr:hypothetical protein [Bacillus cereus]UOX98934.1 hypothetical protein MWG54_27310 [Bacillus cereus]
MMKKLCLVTLFLFVILIVFSIFIEPLRGFIGNGINYIRVILYCIISLLLDIIIANFLVKTIKGIRKRILKKKPKEMKLFAWTGGIQDIEAELKLIIGNSIVSKDIIGNIGIIKKQIKRYFYRDVNKLKSFRAYLNVVEKDSTVLVFQTFIFAILSSAFASMVVTGRIVDVTKYLLPKMDNGLSQVFYYGLGTAFVFFIIGIMIAYLMSHTDKTRVRIIQEVIDICIEELENEKKCSVKKNL